MPLEKDIEADADLATILGQFTNYIGNERVRAYNEGVDEERARCVKIAEGCLVTYAASGNLMDEAKQIDMTRKDIAAAIRAQL